MSFFNLLVSGTSLFNFNLQSLPAGSGFSPALQLPAPEPLTPEQMAKETSCPAAPEGAKAAEGGPAEGAGRESRVELFTKQQQLINQYMHLNIQLLSKKLSSLQQVEKAPKSEQPQPGSEIRPCKKKIKKVNSCGHGEKQHYAKGMCGNCYHKYGRNKKPWNCPHDKLYANGMCQNCYINSYNRKKREEKEEEEDRNEEPELHSELKEEQLS